MRDDAWEGHGRPKSLMQQLKTRTRRRLAGAKTQSPLQVEDSAERRRRCTMANDCRTRLRSLWLAQCYDSLPVNHQNGQYMSFLFVLTGGALGSLLRYAAGLLLPSGTFFVNMVGSFLIGLLATWLPAGSPLRLLLITGFLGGFTTFSAFQWELLIAAQNGLPWLTALNAVASVVLGFAFCWAGAALATMLK